MKLLPSSEVLLLVHTMSGTQYRFREYEKGKWEMLRDGDNNFSDKLPQDKWIHIQMLPVIKMGSQMIIYLGSGEHIRTTQVTFVGRNN
jgi:hypothetical protein